MKLFIKSIVYLFAFSSLFTACSGGSHSSDAPISVDLTGFTQKNIAGSNAIKVEKRNNQNRLVEEGILINGKRNGTWLTYYTDKEEGRIQTLSNYVDDQLNGLYITFSNRGQVETQTSYVNGQYHGLYCKYNFGNLEETVNYVNGQMDGIYKKFYNNNKIQTEAQYRNGQQHGFYKYYDQEGKIIMEYEYDNGKKVTGGLTSQ